jgi:hypothetical protein
MKNKENEIPEDVIKEDIVEETSDTPGDDVSFEEVNDEGEVDARATIKKLREKIKKRVADFNKNFEPQTLFGNEM